MRKSPITTPEELLRTEIESRCARNPAYSMRAFARASGISHTVISLVLTGKRKLSKTATRKLADFLELDPSQSDSLMRIKTKAARSDNRRQLPLDSFEVISDWYHYAILSLLELPEAKLEARWVSKRLQIKVVEAKFAIERLQRLNLIEQTEDGRWRQSGQPLKIDNAFSTAATRKFHRGLLSRAVDCIEQHTTEVRDYSAITFAMDRSCVDYARKRITEFRRQLSRELEAFGPPNEVYELSVQLFPLTQIDTGVTP